MCISAKPLKLPISHTFQQTTEFSEHLRSHHKITIKQRLEHDICSLTNLLFKLKQTVVSKGSNIHKYDLHTSNQEGVGMSHTRHTLILRWKEQVLNWNMSERAYVDNFITDATDLVEQSGHSACEIIKSCKCKDVLEVHCQQTLLTLEEI